VADTITWYLNADASQVRAEMNRAVAAVTESSTQMTLGLSKVELANGGLLKSHSSVARATTMAAQDLLRGAGALDVFSNSATFLATALRLPLGPLLALVTAALGVNKLREIKAEFAALNKEAAELEKKDLTKLKTDALEKAKADAERVLKGLKEQETGVKAFARVVLKPSGRDPDPVARRSDALRESVFGDAYSQTRPQRADFERLMAEEYHKKRLESIPKEVDAELARRNKESKLQADVDKFRGNMQLSLAEVAKEGLHKKDARVFDNTKPYYGDIAQEALDEQAAGRRAMLKQDFPKAVEHYTRAEELKASIPSVQGNDFKSALSVTEATLREIATKVTFQRQK